MPRITRHFWLSSAVLILVSAVPAWANSQFVIENPPLDYEVIDAYPYDGFGDFGPFDGASSVLFGYTGEARECIEFDISPFHVPAGEQVTSALFQVYIMDANIAGMGIAGITPDSVATYGYPGNGVMDLSDFEHGYFLSRVELGENPYIGQQLTFDITEFVQQLVSEGRTWVGLNVRAEQLGGIMLFEGPQSPMLTIQTAPVPEPTTLALAAAGVLLIVRRR